MRLTIQHFRPASFLLFALLSLSACSASRPVDPSAPVRSGPPYPLTLAAAESRRERSLAAWKRLNVGPNGNAAVPVLAPVTSTITSLPRGTVSLHLPQIGDPATKDDTVKNENLREALRRFIASAGDLLGTGTSHLSLIESRDQETGRRLARYEQRPFLRPLRNGYGLVKIVFSPDLRVEDVSSTAIPVDEQLQRAVNDLTPRLKADELTQQITSHTLTYTDAAGKEQPSDFAPGGAMTVRELVVYPTVRTGENEALDFHLAWEIDVKDAGQAVRTVYLDAITHRILSPTQQPAQ